MEELKNTNTHSDDRSPLWKQILGAVIGGSLALSLYYAYDFARPKLTAYLTIPEAQGGRTYELGASNIADKTMDEGKRKRILSRNMRTAGMLADNPEAVEDHSMDIAWPGHDEQEPEYVEAVAQQPMQDPMMYEEEQADPQAQEGVETWDDLWEDILTEEEQDTKEFVEQSDAEDLPDTGFGLGFIAAGAAGGAWGSRLKKRKAENLKR